MSDNLEAAAMLLPWSLVFALLLSSFIHQVLGLRKSSQDGGEALDEKSQEPWARLDEKERDDASRDTARRADR